MIQGVVHIPATGDSKVFEAELNEAIKLIKSDSTKEVWNIMYESNVIVNPIGNGPTHTYSALIIYVLEYPD